MSIQEQFYKSIEDGDIENFNLLMNNKKDLIMQILDKKLIF